MTVVGTSRELNSIRAEDEWVRGEARCLGSMLKVVSIPNLDLVRITKSTYTSYGQDSADDIADP